jgi:hypothetical protein
MFLASILSLTCGNGPVRRVGFWLREPDRATAEQTRLQSRPSFSLSCQLLVSTLLWCGGCPWLSGLDQVLTCSYKALLSAPADRADGLPFPCALEEESLRIAVMPLPPSHGGRANIAAMGT